MARNLGQGEESEWVPDDYDNGSFNSTPDIGGGLQQVEDPGGDLGGGGQDQGPQGGISIGPSVGSPSGGGAMGGGPSGGGSLFGGGGRDEAQGGGGGEPGGSNISSTPKMPSTPGLSSGAVSNIGPPAQSKGVIPFTPMGAPTRPKSSLFGGLATGLTKGGFGSPQFGAQGSGTSIDQLIQQMMKRQKGLF